MNNTFHRPVLVETVSQFLITQPDGIYVDGTLGGGGHAEMILKNLSPRGTLVGFDVDNDALEFAKHRLNVYGERVIYLNENYSTIKTSMKELGHNTINGFLLDLGVSSHQIDKPERGFSFQNDSRIDMRMNKNLIIDGWEIVNTYDPEQLATIFYRFGEEHLSRRIAKRIVDARQMKAIDTTGELSFIIESVVGRRYLQKSLARVFQAIRIVVNNEMDHLRRALQDSLNILIPGGRMVIISYHSLEDRMVKDFFREQASKTIPSGNKYIPDKEKQCTLKIITKKPITATIEEQHMNVRARSAKLRAAERVSE